METIGLALVALALAIAGGFALFDAWCRRGSRGRSALGWGLLVAAAVLCIVGYGPEYGVAYALIGLSGVGALFVLCGTEQRKPRREAPRDPLPGDGAGWRSTLLTLILALPVAGAAAAYGAVVAIAALPGEAADRYAFAILAMPLLWGIFAWAVLAARRPARGGAVLAALTVAGAAVVHW